LRIRDVYPGSRFLPIPDPGSGITDPKTATKERGEKICCQTFFCSHKFHKILNYFIFKMLKKKIWASFQRVIELFIQKFAIKPKKYGVEIWDPEKKNLFRIPDPGPGVKKAPDPGSRIGIRNTGWWVMNALASPSMTGEMAWSSPEMVNPAPVIAFRNLNTNNQSNPLFGQTRGVLTTNTSNPLFGAKRGCSNNQHCKPSLRCN
jgi:hypothetical protein